MRNPLLAAASALCALVLSAASTPALAATNQQSGLVNVNVQDVTAQVPVSVAVPVGVAADVCNISAAVLAQQANTGQAQCTALSDSTALNQAVAQSITTGGGGASNNQSGLVNVNVQGLALQVPVSVAVPIGWPPTCATWARPSLRPRSTRVERAVPRAARRPPSTRRSRAASPSERGHGWGARRPTHPRYPSFSRSW